MQIKNKLLRLKKKYIFFISYFLFIIFFSTTFLYANTFKVSDIKISEPFELNFNKDKAIDKGFRSAFTNLISMITTSGDSEKIKNISLKKLKSMVDSFTISDEKFIDDEYFAKLEVTFNKKNTLLFLEKKNIFPSIPIRNKVLLVPILVDLEFDKIYFFTDNIFYKKWNDKIKNYHLLDYLLPSEDLEDLIIIQKNYGYIEDYDFKDLIKKYDLEDYIITIIFKNQNELKVLSKINLNNSFKVHNQIFKKIDLENEESFQIILDNLKTIYEDNWKRNNQINTSIKLPLTVLINSREYNKIQALEKTLNNLDLISDFYILKFNNENTFFRIIYNGSPKTFLNDLKKRNFDLVVENNIWKIK
jgi:acyl CoA:acetate/3-ketoacid CoA transferase alpha subunit